VIDALPRQAAGAIEFSLRWEDDAGGNINTVDIENNCEK
jgi:hypothetical protein